MDGKPAAPSIPPALREAVGEFLALETEWRPDANRTGHSWTLWLRLYQPKPGGKKRRIKAWYVAFINQSRWEALKRFNHEQQRNIIQAEFNFRLGEIEAELLSVARSANGAIELGDEGSDVADLGRIG